MRRGAQSSCPARVAPALSRGYMRIRGYIPGNAYNFGALRRKKPMEQGRIEHLRQQLHQLLLRLGIHTDSKQFMDQPCITSWAAVEGAMRALRQRSDWHEGDVRCLLEQHFGEPGSDLECVLMQQAAPGWAQELPDPLKSWAHEVLGLWSILYRQVRPEVGECPDNHTLLQLPHPFIIPGDRFRECYYWDSYWSLRGLLAAGQVAPATHLVANLLVLLQRHGFVPNGARTYYLNRSQPPLLSAMVVQLYAATGDAQLLERALPLLVSEHRYWTSGHKAVRLRAADGAVHRLSRYYADWDQPRPESLAEDCLLAEGLAPGERSALLRHVASACESGWDFSSRWLAPGQGLRSMRTTQVVPADLNGLLFQLATHIAYIAGKLGQGPLQQQFQRAASEQLAALQALMWDEGKGCWRDLLLHQEEQQQQQDEEPEAAADHGPYTAAFVERGPAASDYVPLWCGCCAAGSAQAQQVAMSLSGSGLVQPGGLATTLAKGTGQQWDWPNVWPPLQHLAIEGLHRYCGEQGKILALDLAGRFLGGSYRAFRATGQMHEKYSAELLGGVGSGGEYTPQVGFGWTNGVVLDLLKHHGKSITMRVTPPL